jgi:hypothetical protein
MVIETQQNPYITDPTLTQGYRNIDGATDKLIGGVKAVSAVAAVPGIVGSVGLFSAVNGGQQLLNNMPLTGWMVGDPKIVDNAVSLAGEGVKDGFSIGMLGKVVGAAVAVSYGIKAINELRAGNMVGAAGQVTRAVGEGFISALGFTGIAAIPNIASKLFTGKFLTTHIGDFIENTTEGTLNMLGGAANGAKNFVTNNPGKTAAIATAAAIPAAVAVSRSGYGQNVGGSQLYMNSLPPGAQRQAAVQSAPQEIQEQYAMNSYGKSDTHFRDMVIAQRGGQQPQIAVNSGNAAFAQQIINERAQQALAQQGITG